MWRKFYIIVWCISIGIRTKWQLWQYSSGYCFSNVTCTFFNTEKRENFSVLLIESANWEIHIIKKDRWFRNWSTLYRQSKLGIGSCFHLLLIHNLIKILSTVSRRKHIHYIIIFKYYQSWWKIRCCRVGGAESCFFFYLTTSSFDKTSDVTVLVQLTVDQVTELKVLNFQLLNKQ